MIRTRSGFHSLSFGYYLNHASTSAHEIRQVVKAIQIKWRKDLVLNNISCKGQIVLTKMQKDQMLRNYPEIKKVGVCRGEI